MLDKGDCESGKKQLKQQKGGVQGQRLYWPKHLQFGPCLGTEEEEEAQMKTFLSTTEDRNERQCRTGVLQCVSLSGCLKFRSAGRTLKCWNVETEKFYGEFCLRLAVTERARLSVPGDL